MYKRKHSAMLRVAALLLAAVLILPVNTRAATAETVMPRGSIYLDSYSAYVYPAAGGKIQVWFDVLGTCYLDSVGALTIQIFQSTDNSTWEWYTTFTHNYNPQMLSYNDNYHCSSVECQGVPGRYYKAYVCIWGGKDGGGDTRYYYTSSKRAVSTVG